MLHKFKSKTTQFDDESFDAFIDSAINFLTPKGQKTNFNLEQIDRIKMASRLYFHNVGYKSKKYFKLEDYKKKD